MQYFIKAPKAIKTLKFYDDLAYVFNYKLLKELKKFKNNNIFLNSLIVFAFNEAPELFTKPKSYFLDQVKRALFKVAKLKVFGVIIKLPTYNLTDPSIFGVKNLDIIARLGELLNVKVFIDSYEDSIIKFILENKTRNSLSFINDIETNRIINLNTKLVYFDNHLFLNSSQNDQDTYLTKLRRMVHKDFLGIIFKSDEDILKLINIINEELN